MVAPSWWGKHGREEGGEIAGAGEPMGEGRGQGNSGDGAEIADRVYIS